MGVEFTYTPVRTACVRESDDALFLAVKQPFEEGDDAYRELELLADRVCLLNEGSQVFVYPKLRPEGAIQTFSDDLQRRQRLMDRLGRVMEDIGGLAVYPTVRSLEGQALPS